MFPGTLNVVIRLMVSLANMALCFDKRSQRVMYINPARGEGDTKSKLAVMGPKGCTKCGYRSTLPSVYSETLPIVQQDVLASILNIFMFRWRFSAILKEIRAVKKWPL